MREINVDGTNYRWNTVAIETVIDIQIEQQDSDGQKLRVGYFYQSKMPKSIDPTAVSIPDKLISKLIMFARKQGWEPGEVGLVEFFMYGEDAGPFDWL